jgi:hypothetical protein
MQHSAPAEHETVTLAAVCVAEDMRGFNGPITNGMCLTDVFVKGKVDTLNIAFATEKERNLFSQNVVARLDEISKALVRFGSILARTAPSVHKCLPQAMLEAWLLPPLRLFILGIVVQLTDCAWLIA